jgi:hypothetical protein
MKKFLVLCLLPAFLFACSAQKKATKSVNTNTAVSSTSTSDSTRSTVVHDGSSFENAIIIDAKGEGDGVNKEYEWLKKNYPGYKMEGQALSYYKNKPYDILSISRWS